MPAEQARRILDGYETLDMPGSLKGWAAWYGFADGSSLYLGFPGLVRSEDTLTVVSVRTEPVPYIHPLTRLRRTLARVLPFLAE
jgi:hypothetical protein